MKKSRWNLKATGDVLRCVGGIGWLSFSLLKSRQYVIEQISLCEIEERVRCMKQHGDFVAA